MTMDKKIFIGIIIISFIICIGVITANALNKKYNITFKNNSKITVTYYLYQIDHKIIRHPKPIAFVIGTLDPGKIWSVKRENSLCYLEWKQKDKLLLKMDPFIIDKNMIFVYGGS